MRLTNLSFKAAMFLVLLYLLQLTACVKNETTVREPRFELLGTEQTNIDFSNDLTYDKDFNIYTYRNFYNGGGIAVADLNNDGLPDIYFTANMKENKLYINKGNFQFEDITEKAGVGGTRAWSTGVTIADVNGDGWLDIYVCNSGDLQGDSKQNELFINQGVDSSDQYTVRFTEEAEKYNLADRGYGTHAVFFDYDKDGDLDVYLLNNSYRSIFDFSHMKNQRPVRDELGGDKLMRNDDNVFTDVSEAAGIYGSEIGFGLGVTVGDVNRDGWPDIFISNDFFERDYLYINQRDGTFKEDLENQILSLSVASMGADMADINNDGYPEVFVTEMLPEDDARFKTKMTFENWDRYKFNVDNGYYHQFTRNVLQLNNGDGTFSEIGRFAGVEATDWSWGALIADFDNDGLKDLFVANGLYRDIIDQDYIKFVSNEEIVKQIVTAEGVNYKKLIDTIPSTPIPNYLFKNLDGLSFENQAEEWGLATPSHSNGAVYADLDNDGDLDLIVNNVNAPAFIYRNKSENFNENHHYLKVKLVGIGRNPFAVGAKVTLKSQGKMFYLENIPVRGFQSSVEYCLNFGLGAIDIIDSLIVEWPDDQITIQTGIESDQILTIHHTENQHQGYSVLSGNNAAAPRIFRDISADINLDYVHQENQFVDFDRDRMIYHMISTEGPKFCIGDVDRDGLEDFFVGGAANSAGALFRQNPDGSFSKTNEQLFEQERGSEDLDCIFFDADNDGDLDLYVARGGNEFLMASSLLTDQLYFNDGSGTFTRSAQYLPTFKFESTACVQAVDYDHDGDLDLFVGIRLTPGYYGMPCSGYILNNNGRGIFQNVTDKVAPELLNIGMITDALWLDYDGDGDVDLIVVGEWMPITFFENNNGRFTIDRNVVKSLNTEGWWNCIRAGDFDGDGDLDLVVANHGLNSRFEASQDKPLSLYLNDFDNNGTPDPVFSQYNGEESYPLALRHDLTMQIPSLRKKYQKYHDYKEQTVRDIFGQELVDRSLKRNVHILETSYLENNGDGTFNLSPLPSPAQFSPTYGLLVDDFDYDGKLDILLGGNLYGAKPEVGRYDANYGLLLKGNGDNTFQPVYSKNSGFKVIGEIRDINTINVHGKKLVLVAKNNAEIQVFEF